MMNNTTVVLGGGGVWGEAWMTGVAMGLADEGVDLKQASTFIGTSAGSIVAGQLASELSITQLFARQSELSRQVAPDHVSAGGIERLLGVVNQSWTDPDTKVRALVELSLNTPATMTAEDRRRNAVDRLGVPLDDWPRRTLLITAVDLATGQLRTFDAQSGASVTDAICASCALPGVWPPMSIDGRLYMDGGFWRTAENAHLAHGKPSVLVLSPFGASRTPFATKDVREDIAELRAGGSRAALVAPDDAARSTLERSTLGNSAALDWSIREAAAEAGRAQGRIMAEQIIQLL